MDAEPKRPEPVAGDTKRLGRISRTVQKLFRSDWLRVAVRLPFHERVLKNRGARYAMRDIFRGLIFSEAICMAKKQAAPKSGQPIVYLVY